jgi:tetratricopeptide (TPR) repeat protein
MQKAGVSSSTQSKTSLIPSKILSKKFPERKTALLASLPKRTLTRQELVSFVTNLHNDLEKKLPAAKVDNAKSIVTKLNKDAAKIATVGVIGWYKNAPAESALLLTYAATLSPDDNTLNNCGAILNMCGLEDKAIPLLKYALADQPSNATLLNNIGQAYAGLGATDTAIHYLMAAISKCDTHPEACATAAYIEFKKGNTQEATRLAEQSIKGGYTDEIAAFYKSIKKDAQLTPLLQNNIAEKKYFNLNDFEIAPNCTNWGECEMIYAKQQAFQKKLEELRKQFGQMIAQNGPSNIKSAADYLQWAKNQKWGGGPLSKVASALRSDLFGLYADQKEIALLQLTDTLRKLGDQEERPERKAFDDKWDALLKTATGARYSQLAYQQCLERVSIDNKYFEKRSRIIEKFKRAWIDKDIKVYDDVLFLTVLISPNEQAFKADAAAQAEWLLSQFGTYSLVTCYPNNKPNCSQLQPKKQAGSNSPDFGNAKCPINIEAPFVIGKVNLDCTSFKFEIGEGIVLNFEKNFVTRESTVALGLGASVHLPGTEVNIPVINVRGFVPVEAGMKEQFYIKFDRDNQPSDLGLSWEAELDVKGINTPEIKTGYTIGVNSGWNFEEGALQSYINPSSVPVNPNVKIYTPKSN